MSGMGSLDPVTNPRLEGLRKWSVKGFEKYLIFYLSFDDSILTIEIRVYFIYLYLLRS